MKQNQYLNVMNNVDALLCQIGEDNSRTGLKDTPKRVAKMYLEIFRGYSEDPPKVTTFPNGEDGLKVDQMITDTGYFYSHCEHHMVPFFGEYYFGYIPNKKILGLSKISRIVDHFSAKLQIQERLNRDVVDYLHDILEPQGIIFVTKARHLCKEMRGTKKYNSPATCSEIRGEFEEPEVRMEFFELIKLR